MQANTNAYTFPINISGLVLQESPRVVSDDLKLYSYALSAPSSCNLWLMDLSALAAVDITSPNDDTVAPGGFIPPQLVNYFCNLSDSLIVDFGDELKPLFNSKSVISNLTESPRFFIGGFGNGGEFFVADDGDIAAAVGNSQRLVPGNGTIPCGPGYPSWRWRFQNGTMDHCTDDFVGF